MGLREYDYIRGNTATVPKRNYEDIEKQRLKEKQQKQKLRKEREAKNNKVSTAISLVSYAVLLGTLTLILNGFIYKNQQELSLTEKSIVEQRDISEALRVDMLKYASFNGIKETAEKELDMVYPSSDSTITIDMSKEYFAHLNNGDSGENTIFTKLKNWFN